MANCLFFKTCLKRNFIVWFIGRIKIYLLSDYFSLPLYSVIVTKIFKGMCLVIPVECRIFKGWDYLFFTHVHTHEIFSSLFPFSIPYYITVLHIADFWDCLLISLLFERRFTFVILFCFCDMRGSLIISGVFQMKSSVTACLIVVHQPFSEYLRC